MATAILDVRLPVRALEISRNVHMKMCNYYTYINAHIRYSAVQMFLVLCVDGG